MSTKLSSHMLKRKNKVSIHVLKMGSQTMGYIDIRMPSELRLLDLPK